MKSNTDYWNSGGKSPQYFYCAFSGVSRVVGQVILFLNANVNPFEVRVGDEEEETWFANPSCGR